MGVERSVTRWYAQRQILQYQLAQLEELQLQRASDSVAPEPKKVEAKGEGEATLAEQIVAAQRRLEALGHCPKPMMG